MFSRQLVYLQNILVSYYIYPQCSPAGQHHYTT
uniref:Uncharacterized protein n=1 Tax=Zea mays TaxID=4577 RepID=B6T039_MAIZE|nr:hypothetical protein [Zea mays]